MCHIHSSKGEEAKTMGKKIEQINWFKAVEMFVRTLARRETELRRERKRERVS